MHALTVLIALPFVASLVFAQPVPAELSALLEKARLGSPVAWCRGEFRSGRPAAYVVAVPGRYLVVESDALVTELASFTGGAELSCYTPAEARKLHRTIAQSETIQGRIIPRWRTTVVCGFVEDTRAVCWQYSPRDRRFVKVGEWVT